MASNSFVRYLNTLHNVDAENPSAYTEMCVMSPFFGKTMVERDVGNYIDYQLTHLPPHVFILTGHAGDGKTAILYQVLRKWGVIRDTQKLPETIEVQMPNGSKCYCIKDFSELEADKRVSIFRELLSLPKQGKSAFLVANTGPLISTITALMQQEEVNKLVGAIDDNEGKLLDYSGTPICTINVATIDNSSFVYPFLNNILNEKLWEDCNSCEKAAYCPIYTNRNLMAESKDNISSFIAAHYIRQQEYGNKLTIRQIVAHLAFSITGGLSCNRVNNTKSLRFNYLCSNNFFGYRGILLDAKAASIKAIADVIKESYDQKRIRADEQLFIKDDLSSLPNDVQDILEDAGQQYHLKDGWQQAIRRAYIFLNNEQSSEMNTILKRNIFSPWFPQYLKIRKEGNPSAKDKDLVLDALKMLFLGSLSNDSELPITMRREENSSQCVQLVYDDFQKKNIKLITKEANDFSVEKHYRLYLRVKSSEITMPLNLPLMDYFEEMRRGAIQTNIDPQLSQGIDSLRAQLIALAEDDDSEIELRIMTNEGWNSLKASFEGDKWYID